MSTTSSTLSLSSIELWAASKFIGRECSTINKDYLLCKKVAGTNPHACEKEGELVTSCTNLVVAKLNKDHPKEFQDFQKCLDYNDYRFGDCRASESALLRCWNKNYA